MYCGTLILTRDIMIGMIHTCSYLQLLCGVELCVGYMTRQLEIDNALHIYNIGSRFSQHILNDNAGKFIAQHFLQIIILEDWPKLMDSAAISELLGRDDLIGNELDVFQSLISWYKFNQKSRNSGFTSIFSKKAQNQLNRPSTDQNF